MSSPARSAIDGSGKRGRASRDKPATAKVVQCHRTLTDASLCHRRLIDLVSALCGSVWTPGRAPWLRGGTDVISTGFPLSCLPY